jgi:hypothetical protein
MAKAVNKIKFVRFHQGLHAPGWGDLGNSLPNVGAGKTIEGLEMVLEDGFLRISGRYKGSEAVFFVPSANIVLAQADTPSTPVVTIAKGA